jgi:hypothetical protein
MQHTVTGWGEGNGECVLERDMEERQRGRGREGGLIGGEIDREGQRDGEGLSFFLSPLSPFLVRLLLPAAYRSSSVILCTALQFVSESHC